jgi:hypothetical protein
MKTRMARFTVSIGFTDDDGAMFSLEPQADPELMLSLREREWVEFFHDGLRRYLTLAVEELRKGSTS